MSIGWIAGALRGRALAGRRLGEEGVEALAARTSLTDALEFLSTSSYGSRIRVDLDLAVAQRAVAETALWHLRVLAGWLPPHGVQSLRAIAGWFEVLDLESRALTIAADGRWNEPPLPLGALATVWPRAASASTLHELRLVLAHSAWGDPGADALPDILLGLRLGWSRTLRTVVPEAQAWSDGALTLALAKTLFVGPQGERRRAPRVPELGTRWSNAADLTTFARAVPASGRWVLREVHQASDLWRAERLWWVRVDRQAAELLLRRQLGRSAVMAAATLLVTDCWRTRAALERAARGSSGEESSHARG